MNDNNPANTIFWLGFTAGAACMFALCLAAGLLLT